MFFFAFGIDPLITYLDRRLSGILITSIPVLGPVQQEGDALAPLEGRYRVISYADDLKPAVTSMAEFKLVDDASAKFEAASGYIEIQQVKNVNSCPLVNGENNSSTRTYLFNVSTL